MRDISEAFTKVYSKWQYWILTIAFAFILFSFNALIANYEILFSEPGLFWALLNGSLHTMESLPMVLLIVMSLLAGIVLSMAVFLVKRQASAGAAPSSILLGIIAPSCPSCAVGLLSIMGLGGFLSILPFKGLELGFAGVILLAASIIYLSGKVASEKCEISNFRLKWSHALPVLLAGIAVVLLLLG